MSDEWTGDEYLKELETRLARNVEAACIHYKAKLQDAISQTQPRKRYSGRKGVFYKGLQPSRPFYPPKMVSAQLVRSIDYEAKGLEGRVGSGIRYSAFLEFGTVPMAARPYFAPTLQAESEKLDEILTKP